MTLRPADYPGRHPLGGWADDGVEERRRPTIGLLSLLTVIAVVIATVLLTHL